MCIVGFPLAVASTKLGSEFRANKESVEHSVIS